MVYVCKTNVCNCVQDQCLLFVLCANAMFMLMFVPVLVFLGCRIIKIIMPER